MCFGMQETGRKETSSSQTFTPNPAVAKAATSNIDFATGLRDGGFTPYSGEQVANFSPMQGLSFDLAKAVAGNGTAPRADQWIQQYASAPAGNVQAGTIASRMSPYMSQYVMQALAPQLYQMDQNDSRQRQSLDAAATSSNAFGDARTGVERANLEQVLGINRAGTIGQAYDRAFQTAIGAGATDVSNDLSAQTTNAGLTEQMLARALQGSSALQGLQNQQMGIAKGVNEFGQQQTAQEQARLTAAYNQWLMAQQHPYMAGQFVNQTTQTGAQAMPASRSGESTQTDYAPDNSGWALAGSLASLAAAPFTGGASLAAGLPGMFSSMAGGGTGFSTNPWSDAGMFGVGSAGGGQGWAL